MKNIFKTLAMAAMSIVMVGLVACDPEPDPTPVTPPATTQSALYAFQFDGQTVAAGDTILYNPTKTQIDADLAQVHFYMVNKTDEELSTVMKVELVSGPAELNMLEICYDDNCRNYSCPWTSEPFTLVPGVNTDMRMTIDYAPSVINGTSIYRITIGKGSAMEEPQVMFLNMAAM